MISRRVPQGSGACWCRTCGAPARLRPRLSTLIIGSPEALVTPRRPRAPGVTADAVIALAAAIVAAGSESAANLLVDLANGIDACSSLYPGPEALEITLFADEIAGLVRECVTYAGVEEGLEDADG